MSNVLAMINGLKKSATKEITPVTDNQWSTYQRLVRAKYQTILVRETFTAATISKEIDRLIALPNAYKASPQQIKKLETLCIQLGINMPKVDGLSNVEVSVRISKLMDMVPPSAGQLRRLVNYYRFGIVSELPEKMSQNSASVLIGEHEEDYNLISDAKCSDYQVAKIQELEAQRQGHRVDRISDIVDRLMYLANTFGEVITSMIELSKLSYDEASIKIEQLEAEAEAVKQIVKSDTRYHERFDASRSVDNEKFEKLEWGDKDFAWKLATIRKVKRELFGVTIEENDFDEQNIDSQLLDTLNLAVELYGEDEVNAVLEG